jgi:hypothetical protein
MTAQIEAVLPLIAADVERARILLRSLQRNASGLSRLWVITRPQDVAPIRAAFASFADVWELRVVSEVELVPEFARSNALRGWHKQQLVKLAVAEHVQTAHYLTLDADVICVRPFTPEQLAPEGKGLCHVIEADLHPDWYRGSLQVLGVTARRLGVLHNVTPAVLSRAAVLALQEHLTARANAGVYRADWLGLRQRAGFALARARGQLRHSAPWRWYLMHGAPWTEYALYYSYLEATDQFERYHTLTPDCIYAVERSVWRADRDKFDSWDPAPLFCGAGAPYFAIVQSITRLAPERIWAKVAPFLE